MDGIGNIKAGARYLTVQQTVQSVKAPLLSPSHQLLLLLFLSSQVFTQSLEWFLQQGFPLGFYGSFWLLSSISFSFFSHSPLSRLLSIELFPPADLL